MFDNLMLGLVGLNVYAAVLVVARSRVFHTTLYRPMLVNIGLAVAPLAILALGGLATVFASAVNAGWVPRILVLLTLAVWLLVLPNSAYLVTELNLTHRKEGDGVPLWFDIVLVITVAMSGVVNTAISVFAVQFLYGISRYGDVVFYQHTDVRLVPTIIIVLVAVGMYLGRYIRFNSWDIMHPVRFWRTLADHFADRGNRRTFAGFTLTYSAFLALMYLVLAGTAISAIQNYPTMQ